MTIWLPNLASKSGPKYRQIADAIGESIADGRLAEGARLPAQRDLAYDIGVSLNTVSRAYADAIERGFVHGEVGRGTYVRASGPLPPHDDYARLTRSATGVIDFSLNLPAPGESAAALANTLAELKSSNRLASFLDYQLESDQNRHAVAAARWLQRVGLEVDTGNIVLTCGAQHGLMVAMLAMLRPGDVLLTEALTYAPVKAIAQHLNFKVTPVAMDQGGLVPAALDAACAATAARTLYCLPTLHTPLTTTMDETRRQEIAAVARKHDLQIIEDDVFGCLPASRPKPLAHYAPERTIYITSVSKSLAPGLRVGYVCAPEPHVRPLRAAVNMSCWMPPPLMAEIASIWIEEGTADRLNEAQRAKAAARQALARQILPKEYLNADPGGLHAWLELPPHWTQDAFRAEAERQGVKLVTAETFAVEQNATPNAVRLCLSHEVSEERVTRGLETIVSIMHQPTAGGALII